MKTHETHQVAKLEPSKPLGSRAAGMFRTFVPIVFIFSIFVCFSAKNLISNYGIITAHEVFATLETETSWEASTISTQRQTHTGKEPIRSRIMSPRESTGIRLSRFHDKKTFKAISLGRTIDKALNYMKRKEGLMKANFTVHSMRFSHWYRAHDIFKRDWARFDDADAFLCLSKTYCFDEELYMKIEKTGAKMDRIYGQLESWSNKMYFCNAMRSALRSWTPEGASRLRKFTFDCWVLGPKSQTDFLLQNEEFFERLNEPNFFDFNHGLVFKRTSKGGGAGVYFKSTKDEIQQEVKELVDTNKTFVIQPRLANPLLINNRKFDLRCHVLVTSVNPIRAYLHTNGIVRFASGEYSKEVQHSSKQTKRSFLTNLSVNNRVANTEDLTWTHKQFREYLKDDGPEVFRRIDEAIAEMLVASEKSFQKIYSNMAGDGDFRCRSCYQQIGVDILLDADLQPHIMEVNGNPMQNFKDEKITELCKDFQSDITKLLYGKHSENYKEKLISSLESILPAGTNFDNSYDWLDDDYIEYLLHLEIEQENMNGFRLIYPPSRAAFSRAMNDSWKSYLEYLECSRERIAFHNVLVALQKQRVNKCVDTNNYCSGEVDDVYGA